MGSSPRKHFSREFKLAALARVQDGAGSMSQVARELGIEPGTLRAWKKQLGLPRPTAPSVLPGAQESLEAEVLRLRREVTALRQERDILKKAAACFARDLP